MIGHFIVSYLFIYILQSRSKLILKYSVQCNTIDNAI